MRPRHETHPRFPPSSRMVAAIGVPDPFGSLRFSPSGNRNAT